VTNVDLPTYSVGRSPFVSERAALRDLDRPHAHGLGAPGDAGGELGEVMGSSPSFFGDAWNARGANPTQQAHSFTAVVICLPV
jgi:hypothetical protein